MKKIFALLPVLAFLAVACGETATAPEPMQPELVVAYQTYEVNLLEDHVGATASDFGTGDCPIPPEGQDGWWGWHFLMPGNHNFLSLTVTFEHAGTFTADPFPGTVFVADPDDSHAYIWTPTDDTLLAGSATADGEHAFFVLSHVCPGVEERSLEVSKTAFAEFDREHFWEIDKKVETEKDYELEDGTPKVWLFIDGSGDETATWTVDVTYEGFEDRDFVVSGEITIENISDPPVAKTITSITDDLGFPGYDDIAIDCGEGFELPYTIEAGEILTCTYSVEVEDANQGDFGTNSVSVAVEDDTFSPYTATADWEFDEPTTEINKTVNIKDISDLFGEVDLGTVTAPNDAQFTYDHDFAWADYGADLCGSYTYNNTATIVETEQHAEATLKVNVQCFIYDSAWAKGDSNVPFCDYFSNWGWTNPILPGTYDWPLWAGAAQCNTDNGTLVGNVTVVYDADGYVTVTFNVDEDYDLKETHVYAGYDMFPKDRRGNDTVAPGQYTNASPFDGSQVYVIAHAVVGYPDPDFGP